MSLLNSFELFEKNPLIHSNFPFLAVDANNNHCVPQRLKFHEMHWHEDVQITLVLDGIIQVKTLNKSIELKHNQAIFINKNTLHQITEIENAHYRTFLFPDIIMQFYPNSVIYKQVLTFLNNHNLTIHLIDNLSILNIIENMNNIAFTKELNYKEYEIVLLINQMIFQLMKTIHLPKTDIQSEQNLSIQKCLSFIHQHYQDDIKLEEIASYGNVSVGYCGRLFKKILKTSPYEYLIDYRIKKSLELLTSQNYTISQIATLVGFNSVSHYIQCFKKKLSITPKKYQKLLFQNQTQKIYDI